MDLCILILDENDETLRELNVHQDGSDSEAADEIAQFVRDNYTVESEI